jgi:(5-formylfuran-3-yl)methyl phosphate synthase
MTLFLASVRDAAEAEMAVGAGVDIVDLKDPGRGALGALDLESIDACVRAVGGRVPVSATIGDLPPEEKTVTAAVLATAARGVDYVKLGLFPGGDAERCLNKLADLAANVRLIVVLFADALPNIDAIGLAARSGASGVMFDTLGKGAAALPDLMSSEALADFAAFARAQNMTMGLAGSLKLQHVPALLGLGPDLLGFRGALCHENKRDKPLDGERLAAVRALIPKDSSIVRKANLPDLAQHAVC